ncbi:hypothetical protein, partial [Xanthomonas oryzae]|uniref:hypothetical protein n=4 Tax=Xanthomonas oryzae TaxID=347 RepID=UPI001C67614F
CHCERGTHAHIGWLGVFGEFCRGDYKAGFVSTIRRAVFANFRYCERRFLAISMLVASMTENPGRCNGDVSTPLRMIKPRLRLCTAKVLQYLT